MQKFRSVYPWFLTMFIALLGLDYFFPVTEIRTGTVVGFSNEEQTGLRLIVEDHEGGVMSRPVYCKVAKNKRPSRETAYVLKTHRLTNITSTECI